MNHHVVTITQLCQALENYLKQMGWSVKGSGMNMGTGTMMDIGFYNPLYTGAISLVLYERETGEER